MEHGKKILIIGGGFAGVRCALDLSSKLDSAHTIKLVSDKHNFEYHAALYRVVTGTSPFEVCIPLHEIFAGKKVEIVQSKATKIDLDLKHVVLENGSQEQYDYLVLALGSETVYFNIPGLKEYSYGFKSLEDALKLKEHLHEVISTCSLQNHENKVCAAHVVVIGGGPSGVELAAELALHLRHLARKYKVDPEVINIDLVDMANRLCPSLSSEDSYRIEKRLRELKVNIFLNRTVLEEDLEGVLLTDMKMKTKTVIWTAGIKANSLYAQTKGLSISKTGKVDVDPYLRPINYKTVFILGDGANTKYSGMAQTAVASAETSAQNIYNLIAFDGEEKALKTFTPTQPFYSIPLGKGWALHSQNGLRLTGTLGWFMRRNADLGFMLSILPYEKAMKVFTSGKALCETCK